MHAKKYLLLTEKPLILYGAGKHGVTTVRTLRSYGIEPVAFADRSLAGKKFEGLPVDTLEKTIERYGKNDVKYVPSSLIFWSEILGILRQNNIPDHNILDIDISHYCRTGIIRRPHIFSDDEMRRLREIYMDMILFVHNVCEKYDIPYYLYGGTLLGAVRHKGFIPWDDDVDLCMFRKDSDRFFEVAAKEDTEGKYNIILFLDKYSTRNNMDYIEMRNTSRRNWGSKNEMAIGIDIMPMDNVVTPEGLLHRLQEKLQIYVLSVMGAGRNAGLHKRLLHAALPQITLKKILRRIICFHNNKPTKFAFYFCGVEGYRKMRTFPKNWFSERVLLEFEGAMLWVPKDYHKVLTAMYDENYMKLPPKNKRITHVLHSIYFGDR